MYKGEICCAVITAGGSGERFAGSLGGYARPPKQFAELAGKPVIERTADIFEKNKLIDGFIMTVNRQHAGLWEEIAVRRGYRKLKASVAGGADRQESVYEGLKKAEELFGSDALVLIHDGVRPLTEQPVLDAVIAAAYAHGGAIAAYRARETIKLEESGFVAVTPDREKIFIAQTPQAFWLGEIISAHQAAAASGFKGSDDAGLAERSGIAVRLVECAAENIKITTPADLALAAYLLKTGGAK